MTLQSYQHFIIKNIHFVENLWLSNKNIQLYTA
jgi:hypothetical protein